MLDIGIIVLFSGIFYIRSSIIPPNAGATAVMKYYYREHIEGYQKIKVEGKSAWNEIHGGCGFENFSSRPFLEAALPELQFAVPHPTVLEYGCGTGPGSCFLAENGFQVNGIDLIPTAIEMAKGFAVQRGLHINFWVQDIVELPAVGKTYDLIVDSYCLQCIVFDEDRQKVFSTVQARLSTNGVYLISTAMFDSHRFDAGQPILDTTAGREYHSYGSEELIDACTGIVYHKLEGPAERDELTIARTRYLPCRRHRKPLELRAELESAGFQVLYQDERYGGNLICKTKPA